MNSILFKYSVMPLGLVLTIWLGTSYAYAQGTAFTYQGRLQDGGIAANGSYDFQFTLWDAPIGGMQQPQPVPMTVTRTGVQVSNGVFTTQLDFGGSSFPGADRYLEISVRVASSGSFTTLLPRQQITGTPYAIRSTSAATADTATNATNATTATNATQLGGVAAGQYVLTGDPRLSDARPPTAGSTNYIQNTGNQQAANFNISGTGTASIFNAASQYNIGGYRVFTADGVTENVFAGFLAGRDNVSGNHNSFFGDIAGAHNESGVYNTFIGDQSGGLNISGSFNTFLGASTFGTTNGDENTFVGFAASGQAGVSNVTAIGTRARVTQNNSLVLGSINGVNGATANTNVGIGTTAPSNRLHVVASLNAVATPTGHVTLIENTSTGTSPDVLALKIGRTTNPDSSNNFITFFNGNDASVSSIEGNGAGGVVLAGPGNDYAEWLPRLDPTETIQPGDVVGVFAGRVSKATRGASQVMVVSSGAIVAGNDPGATQRATHSLIAFIGQAAVRVRGPVQAGEFIVSSGNADGVGLAVSLEKISAEQVGQVLGQAWESSTDTDVKQVRVAIGLTQLNPTVQRLLNYSRQQAAQIQLLKEKMTEFEARLAASERRVQMNALRNRCNRSLKSARSKGNSVSGAVTPNRSLKSVS